MAKTATLTIDSSKVTPQVLAEIEAILYGLNGQEPRMPLPEEIAHIVKGEVLVLDSSDPGTYTIIANSLVGDPTDVGTYLIANTKIKEDPADPGTYLIGAV